jgi:hypothetical protein
MRMTCIIVWPMRIQRSILTKHLYPLVAASLLYACGDDADTSTPDAGSEADGGSPDAAAGDSGPAGGKGGSDAKGGSGGAAGAVDAGADAESGAGESLYALTVTVFDPEWNRDVFVHFSNSLDLGESIDLTKDRAFPGVANFLAHKGRMLVSSGEEPVITEYTISEELDWEEGRSVSFADYPLEDNANFYYQFQLDEHTAYMPYDVTSRIIWDPTEMTITEALQDTKIELVKDGLRAIIGGNRAGVELKGPVRQSVIYADDDYFEFAQDSYIAIYDEKTHEEKTVLTVPCPALSTATVDEAGYTYYSPWEFQGVRALFNEGPKPCFARLKPDLTVDEDWTSDLRDITGGLYVTNLRYASKGLAIANVLDHTKFDVDWEGGYDADVAEMLKKDGDHWSVWLFDVEKKTGKRVEGVDLRINGNSSFNIVDGRMFLFAAYDDYAKSKIFEITADGKATEILDTKGTVSTWFKLR